MIKLIVGGAALLVMMMIGGGLLLLHEITSQGSRPSLQMCQYLKWEDHQLWPQGGGPPLPPGC